MAKTKSELDRKEKRQEILAVARGLFVEAGYDATSMSRIAEQAGVAPNTIYWYFADKDALLIAVLNGMVSDALSEFARRKEGPLEAQVLWLLGVLEDAQHLIATVHARVPLAETVRTWHTNFHRMLEATLHAELGRYGVASADLPHAARAAMFVIEGLLAHPTTPKERRALVRWLVAMIGRTR
jgi:AcrR family transcriptional regulator